MNVKGGKLSEGVSAPLANQLRNISLIYAPSKVFFLSYIKEFRFDMNDLTHKISFHIYFRSLRKGSILTPSS